MPKRKLTLAQKKELDKLNGVVRKEDEDEHEDDDDDDDDEKMNEPGEVKELPELVKPQFKPLSATEASGALLFYHNCLILFPSLICVLYINPRDILPPYPISFHHSTIGGVVEYRRVRCPQHRLTPLRAQWENIITPLVEYLKLQVRFNPKSRAVEMRTSKETEDPGAAQKGQVSILYKKNRRVVES